MSTLRKPDKTLLFSGQKMAAITKDYPATMENTHSNISNN
jgi:hypothetical protein